MEQQQPTPAVAPATARRSTDAPRSEIGPFATYVNRLHLQDDLGHARLIFVSGPDRVTVDDGPDIAERVRGLVDSSFPGPPATLSIVLGEDSGRHWRTASELARHQQIRVEILTDPSHLDRDDLGELATSGSTLRLALSGSGSQRDRVGTTDEPLHRVLGWCREVEVEVRVDVAFTTDHVTRLPQLISHVSDLGCSVIHVSNTSEVDGTPLSPRGCFTPRFLEQTRHACVDVASGRGLRLSWDPGTLDEVGVRPDASETTKELEDRIRRFRPGFCTRFARGPRIAADGSVFACSETDEFRLGDVSTTPIESIWNGQEAQELRRGMLTDDVPERCRRCVYHRSRHPATDQAPFIEGVQRNHGGVEPEGRIELVGPAHMSRVTGPPVLEWRAPETELAHYILVIAAGGESDSPIEATKERQGTFQIPPSETNFRIPDSLYDSLTPNLGFWWALWGVPRRTMDLRLRSEARCFIRHLHLERGLSSMAPLPSRAFDGRLPPPDLANFETTMYCNLECEMCVFPAIGTTKVGPHMDISTFVRIADQVFPHVRAWQPSTAGEPLMTRNLETMIDMAREWGVKMELTTNGTLLTDRLVKALVPGLGRVAISLDGAKASTYEDIRHGGDFDRVVDGIKRLRAAIQTVPEDRRPEIGINCTLMERNVRDLPDLVRLTHELGLDMVRCAHVVTVSESMSGQSLTFHMQLAKRYIDEAAEVARDLGVTFIAEPLDAIAHDMALSERGVHEGRSEHTEPKIPLTTVNAGSIVPFRYLSDDEPGAPAISERRRLATQSSPFPATHHATSDARPRDDTIYYCDFLWNRFFVSLDGDVRPCCVPGSPTVGNVAKDGFEETWNGETYRAMRQRLAAKDPAPVCRGCRHICEVHDRIEIDQCIQGADIPVTSDLLPLPPVLKGRPPELRWKKVHSVKAYRVEVSGDDFQTIAKAGEVRMAHYDLRDWEWCAGESGDVFRWRVTIEHEGRREQIAEGDFAVP